jgi:hypothetical protein
MNMLLISIVRADRRESEEFGFVGVVTLIRTAG